MPAGAQGLLRAFAEAGVLSAADVHVARALGRLGDEADEDVLLAAALAVRGVRAGSVCVDLATVAEQVLPGEQPAGVDPGGGTGDGTGDGTGGDPGGGPGGGPGDGTQDDATERPDGPPAELPWPASWQALADSPLVAGGEAAAYRPLRLVDGLLYLDRYWQQEQLVRGQLDDRACRTPPPVDLAPLARLFPGPAPDRQRLAVAVAAGRWVSVITGGPGTGKTTTVARLLALLHAQPGDPPRTALAAPTGKAAARLQEAVQEQAAALGLPADLSASTLHRLLGWRPDSRSRFRHDAAHHLPYDVVVVDEASMVSLTMMSRLLDALRPDCRLVLVGDPDQLTPVEAGAVLSDLVARPAPAAGPADPSLPADLDADDDDLDAEERRRLRAGVVRLRVSRRYGAGIGELAEAVRAGDADRVLELLSTRPDLSLSTGAEGLRAQVVSAAAELTAAAAAGDVPGALRLLGRHRLLCAHRHGPYGVSSWNEQVRLWTGSPPGEAYAGRPLLVTANDRETGLYNGDTGVVVQTRDGLRAAFGRADGPQLLALSRLSAVQTVHAMTVHRSQGSQYDAVTVLLPTEASAVLTRELLYTAVTRASSQVRVVATEQAVRAALARRVVRASGLRRVVGGLTPAAAPVAGPAGAE